MFRSGPRVMALLKYFKHIEPYKEERIQSVLPKPDYPSACMSNAEGSVTSEFGVRDLKRN